MRTTARRNKRIGVVVALAFASALIAALPMLATATELRDVDELTTNANEAPMEDAVDVDGNEAEGAAKAKRSHGGEIVAQNAPVDGSAPAYDGNLRAQSDNDISHMSAFIMGGEAILETGQPVEHLIHISFGGGPNGPGTTLVEGTDYTESYATSDGAALASAPSAVGKYQAIATGKGNYTGTVTKEFEIVSANSVSRSDCSMQIGQSAYLYTGEEITPTIKVTLGNDTLEQGVDFEITGYLRNTAERGDEVVASAKEVGWYSGVMIKGKGRYTGENLTHGGFQIVENDEPQYWALSFKDQSSSIPVVAPTSSKADLPEVVVTNLAGNVLKENEDYTLAYSASVRQGDSNAYVDEMTTFTQEGYYHVKAVCAKGEYVGQETVSMLTFTVVAPEHDLTKATVTMPTPFAYADGKPMTDRLNEEVVVTLNSKQLVRNVDYYRSSDPSNGLYNNAHSERNSGTLGIHPLVLQGNGTEYFGQLELTYEVWGASAPAADKRVDAATGIVATGAVISGNSTFEGEKWVALTASKPAGDAVEAEAQAAVTAATSAGALDVQVFDVKLDQTTASEQQGNDRQGSADDEATTQSLTDDLGELTLSFPVDAQYNGMTATITQIHDGKAMAAKTVTVEGGMANVTTDRLSQFVVAVSPDSGVAATKATSKSTLAATGEGIPMAGIFAVVVIAAIALCVLAVSRKLSRR